jgi:pilus assembly protein CpaE
MLATLDRTDELLVVIGLDVPTLKNVRLALQTLELLSFPANRARFVLNRANSKVGLSKKEIEAALKVQIANEIPSERVVPIAVNRGNPAVLSEPGSDYAKAVRELAKAVVPKEPAAPKGKRRSFSLARS